MRLVTQLDIAMPNVPSSLAKLADVLRAAKVNIDAMYCTEGKESSIVHMLVDDIETAKLALKPLGDITMTPAFSTLVKNEPGAMTSIVRKCAGGNINIRNLVSTAAGKESMVIITVDDMERAKTILK